MFIKRTTTALMLIGVAISFAFMIQLALSQAEHSGLYNHDFSQVAKKPADKLNGIPSQMCHPTCCSPLPVMTRDGVNVEAISLCMRAIFPIDEPAPDGPVLAIDRPPQLS